MARFLTIWRSWEDQDMATSDTYYPTKANALAEVKEGYGVKWSDFKPDDDNIWAAQIGEEMDLHGYKVYLEKLRVRADKVGICNALKHIPHR